MMAHFSSILTYTQLIGYGNEIGTYTIIVWIAWTWFGTRVVYYFLLEKYMEGKLWLLEKNGTDIQQV